MIVLNVGAGGSRHLPSMFKGWEQHTLDIDPATGADVICDAKQLTTLKQKYDAVHCSHNLEHFYKHEVPGVLAGFMHVLKKDGFAHIAVPDMGCLFEQVRGKDIDDKWYSASGAAVTFHDVIYGWGQLVSQGNLYYSHKTGFTQKSLGKAVRAAGFKSVYVAPDGFGNLFAYGFKSKPSPDKLRKLGI